GLPLTIVILSPKIRSHVVLENRGRQFIAIGNLVVWLIACGFWFHPNYIRIEGSLPLQFCNLANLIAAAAVGFRWRTAQALLYFWTFALCIWAFLTPFLMVGPAHAWFWAFWLYHLFIPLGTAWTLSVDRFRPDWKDFKRAVFITVAYTATLAVLNYSMGWNYGFVGAGKPGQPSMIDVLGSYPVRLIWMLLIGVALFLILMLPWRPWKKPGAVA
ncbi:MAG: TIGR02206 family membrane protein, partial [Verrucomicrobiota bacterium]